MVSLLIIAKLPFPIPDPVSDYERRQYPNLRDYINAEVIPEMQKKLRQGFGRAIRTEQDSCVVAILDERAGIGGKYHDAALAALPTCPTTEKIPTLPSAAPFASTVTSKFIHICSWMIIPWVLPGMICTLNFGRATILPKQRRSI